MNTPKRIVSKRVVKALLAMPDTDAVLHCLWTLVKLSKGAIVLQDVEVAQFIGTHKARMTEIYLEKYQ